MPWLIRPAGMSFGVIPAAALFSRTVLWQPMPRSTRRRASSSDGGVPDAGGDAEGARHRQGDAGDAGDVRLRRLVEAGVRFVQVIVMGWDSHDYIDKARSARRHAVDKPVAALLRDLKQRGLLDGTLVVWSGEFGRSPDNGIRAGGQAWGRDHNATAMSVWMAGGMPARNATAICNP